MEFVALNLIVPWQSPSDAFNNEFTSNDKLVSNAHFCLLSTLKLDEKWNSKLILKVGYLYKQI
jgi:hypothetical protein